MQRDYDTVDTVTEFIGDLCRVIYRLFVIIGLALQYAGATLGVWYWAMRRRIG